MLNTEPTGSDAAGQEPMAAAPDTTPPRRTRRRPAKSASADPAAGGLAEQTASAAASSPQAEPEPAEPQPAEPESAEPARTGRSRSAARSSRASSRAAAAEAPEPTEEQPAPRTRRRRKATEPDEQVLFGDSGEIAQEAVEVPVEPSVKVTRSRRKATPAKAADGGPDVTPAPADTRDLTDAAEAPARQRAAAPPAIPPAVFFVAPAAAPPVAPMAAPPATSTAAAALSDEEPIRPARATRATRATKAAKAAAAAAAQPAADEAPELGDADAEPTRSRRSRRGRRTQEPVEAEVVVAEAEAEEDEEDDGDDEAGRRRRRGRRGRGRGKGTFDSVDETEQPAAADEAEEPPGGEEDDDEPLTRRRRRRRRSGASEQDAAADDGVVTVVRIRQPRAARDEVQGVTGSTRLEAKRQRRRDGREQRRTRPPVLSESEFLARREAVDRVMVVRQKGDRTQVAVLEDGILVEHYVTRQSASSMVGNVYLGKVQNVLPSMEAAFVDIGRGRNAVLYAGEVNWDVSGLEGRARSIEHALKSGESVLVQVTKDPLGHKGARLSSHIALSGRHLVYVPNGHASGISRKLSDVERRRLRDVLKNLVPDGAGVIVRTAAEGAAEDDLARDVKRLQAQWDDIQARAAEGNAPALLSSEPDLVIRVVRDLFNEDFREVIIQGSEAYDQVESYLAGVSPDLVRRVRRYTGAGDAFAEWRIDEQILKGLDRKVFLPSGGHLVIDRTEAMTVVDVNTGKYTGAGGNLEETVTRNNLEAAEEIVRQLRLRDLGGIIVIDFIDMVLESNRDLVLRRLTECLGRDRTKHQVTEITSLGLVQMTRKRIGQGLLEAFSETCDHCKGRGVIIHTEPVHDKARNNVAEKVRSVAASTRTDAADDQVVGDQVMGEAPDEDDLVPTLVTDAREVDDEDDNGGSVRRRTRRGSSRRRTRP
jgi:ribonuclease E